MHVHVGFVPLLITAAQLLILLFFMRMISAKWPDSAIGKALSVLG